MADEIQIDYEPGKTLYFVVRDTWQSLVWNFMEGEMWEWGVDGHVMDESDVPMFYKGGHRYLGHFPTEIPAGRYTIQVFEQAGGAPLDSDDLVGGGEFIWTGTGELTVDKILTNKAVQDKATGVISYYDDDGETVLLTHTPTDGESAITRTPS